MMISQRSAKPWSIEVGLIGQFAGHPTCWASLGQACKGPLRRSLRQQKYPQGSYRFGGGGRG